MLKKYFIGVTLVSCLLTPLIAMQSPSMLPHATGLIPKEIYVLRSAQCLEQYMMQREKYWQELTKQPLNSSALNILIYKISLYDLIIIPVFKMIVINTDNTNFRNPTGEQLVIAGVNFIKFLSNEGPLLAKSKDILIDTGFLNPQGLTTSVIKRNITRNFYQNYAKQLSNL